MKKLILGLVLLCSSVSQAVVSPYEELVAASTMARNYPSCNALLGDELTYELEFYALTVVAAAVLKRTNDPVWFSTVEQEILRMWSKQIAGMRTDNLLVGNAFSMKTPSGYTPEQTRAILISTINSDQFVTSVRNNIRHMYANLLELDDPIVTDTPGVPFQVYSSVASYGYQFDNIDVVHPSDRPFGAQNGLQSPRRLDRIPMPALRSTPSIGVTWPGHPEIHPDDRPIGADNGLRSPRRNFHKQR